VRQPLAELKIVPGDTQVRGAVRKYPDQIRDELNVKKVTIVESQESAGFSQDAYVPKHASIKFDFGHKASQVIAALKRKSPQELWEIGRHVGEVPLKLPSGEEVPLRPNEHLEFERTGMNGWAVAHDRSTLVGVDCRITEELKREGMARDVVRHVQESRKKAELQMEDRIELHLQTDSEQLRQAIADLREYVASETLVVAWSNMPLQGDGVYSTQVSVDGQTLQISLRKTA
jgi:isoleucyl-tRNA synthetase